MVSISGLGRSHQGSTSKYFYIKLHDHPCCHRGVVSSLPNIPTIRVGADRISLRRVTDRQKLSITIWTINTIALRQLSIHFSKIINRSLPRTRNIKYRWIKYLNIESIHRKSSRNADIISRGEGYSPLNNRIAIIAYKESCQIWLHKHFKSPIRTIWRSKNKCR